METEQAEQDLYLIDRIKEGDTNSFRQLIEKYKDVSLSLACSVLKDKQIAEDVLQDSFVKVFQKLHTFKGNAAFSTWLYRIVVNTSYNALKKENKHIILSENSAEIEQLDYSTFDNIKEKDQKKYIQLALHNLKPDEALVLRLFYLCEMKITEIQEITTFKISKIKVLLHRGRQNLNVELQKILGKEIRNLL